MINPRMVRGLDYYTKTTFEVTTDFLGAQNAIVGGDATMAWSKSWVAGHPVLDLQSAANAYWP